MSKENYVTLFVELYISKYILVIFVYTLLASSYPLRLAGEKLVEFVRNTNLRVSLSSAEVGTSGYGKTSLIKHIYIFLNMSRQFVFSTNGDSWIVVYKNKTVDHILYFQFQTHQGCVVRSFGDGCFCDNSHTIMTPYLYQ